MLRRRNSTSLCVTGTDKFDSPAAEVSIKSALQSPKYFYRFCRCMGGINDCSKTIYGCSTTTKWMTKDSDTKFSSVRPLSQFCQRKDLGSEKRIIKIQKISAPEEFTSEPQPQKKVVPQPQRRVIRKKLLKEVDSYLRKLAKFKCAEFSNGLQKRSSLQNSRHVFGVYKR